MKICVYPMILAISLLCTGCVYYGNSSGGTLSEDAKSDLEDARREAQEALSQAREEAYEGLSQAGAEVHQGLSQARDQVREGLSEGRNEMEEEFPKINWAKELFSDMDNDPKPKRMLKSSANDPDNLTDAGSLEEFYKKADVDAWKKADSLPEGLEEDAIFQYQQKETEHPGKRDPDSYYTIAKIILYKDSDYVSVVVMEDLAEYSFGLIPKEYLTSIYQVPKEIIDALKAS